MDKPGRTFYGHGDAAIERNVINRRLRHYPGSDDDDDDLKVVPGELIIADIMCVDCKERGFSADKYKPGDNMGPLMYQTKLGRVLDFRCMPCFELYNFKTRHMREWYWRTAHMILWDPKIRGPVQYTDSNAVVHYPGQDECLLWMLPVEIATMIGSHLREPAMEMVDKCNICESYHLEQCPLIRIRKAYIRMTPADLENHIEFADDPAWNDATAWEARFVQDQYNPHIFNIQQMRDARDTRAIGRAMNGAAPNYTFEDVD